MATARQAILILLFVLGSIPDSAARAGMVLLSASHGTFVADYDGSDRDLQWVNQIPPDERFDGTTSASYRMLSADGVFSTLVDTNLLTSSMEGAHSLLQTTQESGIELDSYVSSLFWFTTDMDVEVSVHGSMFFDLDFEGGASMVLEVFNGNQDRIYESFMGSYMSTNDDLFRLDDSIVLDGGAEYFVSVTSVLGDRTHRFPGPGSTASGEMTLVISTIPEPTSLALLCGGALLARRHWRRRVGNRSVAG